MEELLAFLSGAGITVSAVYLFVICGTIEVLKKLGLNSLKEWMYLAIDGALSIAIGVLTAKGDPLAMVVNSLVYFILTGLLYDYIMAPIRAFVDSKKQ